MTSQQVVMHHQQPMLSHSIKEVSVLD